MCFVSALFEIVIEKGYVGGLGASAFDCLHIGSGRDVAAMHLSDDLSESFTVCGFLVVSTTMST